jgi:hypothetical protein
MFLANDARSFAAAAKQELLLFRCGAHSASSVGRKRQLVANTGRMTGPSVVLILFVTSVTVTTMRVARPLAAESQPDPFHFLQPTIQLTEEERHRLDQREIVLRILPAGGHELAFLAAGTLEVGADTLVTSVRDMPGLKRGPYVPQIGRFSSQPRVEDLRELTLDVADLDEIRHCRPGRCGLKLDPDEVERLHKASGSKDTAAAKSAVEDEFRRMVVERANRYLAHGDDDGQPEFGVLLQHSPYAQLKMPHLVAYLERYPEARLPDCESFLYWSKETYAWKPMITVTHVTILRGNGDGGTPEVVVASRDVFATRYTSGSFVVTLLLRNPENASQHFLVYINRTWIDAVRALWRPFVEYRVKSQAKKVFAGTRDRIERNGLASIVPK